MLNRASPQPKVSHVIAPGERTVRETAFLLKRGHPPYSTPGDYDGALARIEKLADTAHDGSFENMVIRRGWEILDWASKLPRLMTCQKAGRTAYS